VTIAELNELRQKDIALDKQIFIVETFMNKNLQTGMTAEEIAQ
jgi:hypothetical protein